jgi:hypothetical protein
MAASKAKYIPRVRLLSTSNAEVPPLFPFTAVRAFRAVDEASTVGRNKLLTFGARRSTLLLSWSQRPSGNNRAFF